MLKLDIFNPKMLHKCPHDLIQIPSMFIGKSCDGHRWDAKGPSMPIDGIEWSLSTGIHFQPVQFQPLPFQPLIISTYCLFNRPQFRPKQILAI